VQQALAHLFQTFERTGSARGVVQTFNREGLLFPARVRAGERKGELTWSPLTHRRVLRTLHNPRYAGAFAYGQRRIRKSLGGKTITRSARPPTR
jgi:Recombinase